jgi:hypothetical protein
MTDKDNQNKSFFSQLSEYASVIGVLVSSIGVIVGFIVNYKSSNLNDELQTIKSQTERIKNEQGQVQFDREFKFKIYELVLTAIKSDSQKEQIAASVAVQNMVSDRDYKFKDGLLGLIKASPNVSQEVKTEITIARLDLAETQQKSPKYSKIDKIYVDIFYYEEDFNATRTLAKKLRDALKTSDFYEVALVKSFSVAKNKEPNYGISKNIIRYDKAETQKAIALQNVLNSLLVSDKIKIEIEPTKSENNKTNSYVSLFIMNAKPNEEIGIQ